MKPWMKKPSYDNQDTAHSAMTFRRVGHGGVRWASDSELRQPQDGALEPRTGVVDISARAQRGPLRAIAAREPEDARLTGGTRSLMRRMLGLNFASRAKARPSAVSALSVDRTRTA